MFQVHKISDTNCIELKNSKLNVHAKIHLDLGASLQDLKLNGKEVIKNSAALNYQESYASTLMFPFVSRIENGMYKFQDETYQLDKNDTINNCALHGLLYNKAFQVVENEISEAFGSVTLKYISQGQAKGFPFKYEFFVTYFLTKNSLKTQVRIKNTDEKSFPFSLGWHPYFYTENLEESYLTFQSQKKAVLNSNLIVKDFVETSSNFPIKLSDKLLDDCFKLNDTNIHFKTPSYQLEMLLSSESNFLQVYTPPTHKNVVAIEPMTAPGNSFNNKLGLQVLESKEEYNMTWEIKLIDKDI